MPPKRTNLRDYHFKVTPKHYKISLNQKAPACQVELHLQHDFNYIKIKDFDELSSSSDKAGNIVRFQSVHTCIDIFAKGVYTDVWFLMSGMGIVWFHGR